MTDPEPGSSALLPALAVGVLVLAVYSPALMSGFVFDDLYLLEQQTCFRSLGNIPGFFFSAPYDACDYRPMRYVTYALIYALAGLTPWVYHLVNVVLHAGCAVLVYRVLLGLGRSPKPLWAGLAACAWALHPVLSDAVVPAAGLRDVQSTFFVLAAILSFMHRDKGSAAVWTASAVFFWCLALLTKEMAVTMPVLLALVLLVRTGEQGGTVSAIWEKVVHHKAMVIGLAVGVVGFVLFRGVLVSHSNMAGRWWGGSVWTNAVNSVALVWEYVRLTVWPAELVGDYALYTVPVAKTASEWRFLAGLGLVGGLCGLAVACWRRHGLISVGILWFFVALSPVLHIFPHHELMAEHFLHLPLIGVAIALYGLLDAVEPQRRRIVLTVMAVVLVAMTARLEWRIPDYRDNETFGLKIVSMAPGNVRNLGRLSSHYLKAESRDLDKAHAYAWMQWRQSPPGTLYHTEAARKMALIYDAGWDDPARAADFLAWNIGLSPESKLIWRLARLYTRLDRNAEAVSLLQSATRQWPDRANWWTELAMAQLQTGDPSGAERAAGEVERLKPKSAVSKSLLGRVRLAQGRAREAFVAFEHALHLDPEHVPALVSTAEMLCSVGDGEDALGRARRAASLVPDDASLKALVATIESGCD